MLSNWDQLSVSDSNNNIEIRDQLSVSDSNNNIIIMFFENSDLIMHTSIVKNNIIVRFTPFTCYKEFTMASSYNIT